MSSRFWCQGTATIWVITIARICLKSHLSLVAAIITVSPQRFFTRPPFTQPQWERAYAQAVKAINQLPLVQEKDNEKGILIKTNQHGWVALVYTKTPDEGWTEKGKPAKPTSELATDTNITRQVKEALDQFLTEQDKIFNAVTSNEFYAQLHFGGRPPEIPFPDDYD